MTMKHRLTYSFDLGAFTKAQKMLRLSPQEVAQSMGVKPRTVYYINQGKSSPRVESLLAFCNAHRLDIHEFLLEEVAA